VRHAAAPTALHRRRAVTLGLATAILVALPAAPALAAEDRAPVIDKTTLVSVTEVGATIEAQINPEGLEAGYEIKLVWQDADPPAPGEPMTGSHSQSGQLAASFDDQTVSAVLTGMQRGYTYWYQVIAANANGKTKSGAQPFGYLNGGAYPEGEGLGPPREPELSQETLESGVRQTAKIVAEAEAQRRQAKEQEEQQRARETAAEQAIEAAELKRHHEEEAKEALAREEAEHPACLVPALKGDTLSTARSALARAHCRLGVVHRPAHHHGALYVSAQGASVGKRLAHNARVALWLGAGSGAKRASRREKGRR
jgi:hypothetical protein